MNPLALVGILGGLVFVLVGLVLLWAGVAKLRQWRLVASIPTTPAGSVRHDSGPVEIVGEVVPDGPLATGPFSGEACVFGGWGVTMANPPSQRRRKVSPETLAVGRLGGAFRVKDLDGGGSVRVDPDGAELDLRETWGYGIVPGEPLPAALDAFLRAQPRFDLDAALAKGRAIRCSEALLKPGERVYVLGVARQDDAGRTVVGARRGFPFVLSVRPESEVRKGAAAAGVMGILFGAAFTAAGAYAVRAAWSVL